MRPWLPRRRESPDFDALMALLGIVAKASR